MDSAGNLYITDAGNERVRMVNTAGIITTIAGNGILGTTGDGGPATSAELNVPFGLALGVGVPCTLPPGVDSARVRLLTPVGGPVPAKPAITGIVNDASFTAGGAISDRLMGRHLWHFPRACGGDSRSWNTATEIVNGKFPTSLDGTSVTVNGKPAAVEFISPSQVNIQAPDDVAVGPVQVVVTTAAGATNSFTATYATFAPGSSPQLRPTSLRNTRTTAM